MQDVICCVDGYEVGGGLLTHQESIQEKHQINDSAAIKYARAAPELRDIKIPATPNSRWTMLCRIET